MRVVTKQKDILAALSNPNASINISAVFANLDILDGKVLNHNHANLSKSFKILDNNPFLKAAIKSGNSKNIMSVRQALLEKCKFPNGASNYHLEVRVYRNTLGTNSKTKPNEIGRILLDSIQYNNPAYVEGILQSMNPTMRENVLRQYAGQAYALALNPDLPHIRQVLETYSQPFKITFSTTFMSIPTATFVPQFQPVYRDRNPLQDIKGITYSSPENSIREIQTAIATGQNMAIVSSVEAYYSTDPNYIQSTIYYSSNGTVMQSPVFINTVDRKIYLPLQTGVYYTFDNIDALKTYLAPPVATPIDTDTEQVIYGTLGTNKDLALEAIKQGDLDEFKRLTSLISGFEVNLFEKKPITRELIDKNEFLQAAKAQDNPKILKAVLDKMVSECDDRTLKAYINLYGDRNFKIINADEASKKLTTFKTTLTKPDHDITPEELVILRPTTTPGLAFAVTYLAENEKTKELEIKKSLIHISLVEGQVKYRIDEEVPPRFYNSLEELKKPFLLPEKSLKPSKDAPEIIYTSLSDIDVVLAQFSGIDKVEKDPAEFTIKHELKAGRNFAIVSSVDAKFDNVYTDNIRCDVYYSRGGKVVNAAVLLDPNTQKVYLELKPGNGVKPAEYQEFKNIEELKAHLAPASLSAQLFASRSTLERVQPSIPPVSSAKPFTIQLATRKKVLDTESQPTLRGKDPTDAKPF